MHVVPNNSVVGLNEGAKLLEGVLEGMKDGAFVGRMVVVGDIVGRLLLLKLGSSDGISDGKVLGNKDGRLGLYDGFELNFVDGKKEGTVDGISVGTSIG